VAQGADPSKPLTWQPTCLYKAAYHGHFSIVEFLVDYCDVKINDMSPVLYHDNPFVAFEMALHAAVKRGHCGIVKFLADRGAFLEMEQELRGNGGAKGHSSIELAKMCNPQMHSLLKNICVGRRLVEETNNIFNYVQNNHYNGLAQLLPLLADQAIIKCDDNGDNALHHATRNQNVRMMQLLLAWGYDIAINTVNRHDETPVTIAAASNNEYVIDLLNRYSRPI
jgi:ankyrin repeat protein